jgi:Phage tail tube protein, GTA-gp10
MVNPHRGEISLTLGAHTLCFRPSYTALVTAEAEIGPFFAMIERAASGTMTLSEMESVLWACLKSPPADLSRTDFAESLIASGLAHITPVFRLILEAALGGQS